MEDFTPDVHSWLNDLSTSDEYQDTLDEPLQLRNLNLEYPDSSDVSSASEGQASEQDVDGPASMSRWLDNMTAPHDVLTPSLTTGLTRSDDSQDVLTPTQGEQESLTGSDDDQDESTLGPNFTAADPGVASPVGQQQQQIPEEEASRPAPAQVTTNPARHAAAVWEPQAVNILSARLGRIWGQSWPWRTYVRDRCPPPELWHGFDQRLSNPAALRVSTIEPPPGLEHIAPGTYSWMQDIYPLPQPGVENSMSRTDSNLQAPQHRLGPIARSAPWPYSASGPESQVTRRPALRPTYKEDLDSIPFFQLPPASMLAHQDPVSTAVSEPASAGDATNPANLLNLPRPRHEWPAATCTPGTGLGSQKPRESACATLG